MGVGLLPAVELTLVFDLYAGGVPVDIAEFSLWVHNGSGTTTPDSDLAFLAQNAADAWQANVSAAYWCSNVVLKQAIARCFNTSGHTIGEQIKVPATPWAGVNTGKALPWETSLCISEYGYEPGTFAADAKRKRGRYYLPPMSSDILATGGSGEIDGGTLASIFSDQIDFVSALADGSGTSLIVSNCIFSRVTPDLVPTLWLAVDPIVDSQRRRRNKQKATRSKHEF